MKKFKTLVVVIFFGPIFFIHELLHIIFSILVGASYTKVEITYSSEIEFWPEIGLFNRAKIFIPLYKRVIMSYAPLLLPLSVIILSFFSTIFLYILAYLILAELIFILIKLSYGFGINNKGLFLGLFISDVDIEYANNKGVAEHINYEFDF